MLLASTLSAAWRRRLWGDRDDTRLDEARQVSRFRQLASHLETAVWMVSPDFSTTLFVNPAYQRLVGIPISLISSSPQSFFDLVDSEDVAALNSAVQSVHVDGFDDCVVEYRVNLPSGEQRWLRTTLNAIRDDSGAIDCIALYSERRRIRQREWSRQKWRYAMFDRLPDLIWVSGPGGDCVHVNQAWVDFTGRTIVLESGDGWMETVHPDDVASYVTRYRRAFDDREAFYHECRFRREDGLYRWLRMRGAAWVDEDRNFGGFIVSGLDITAARRSEMELKDAHELLSAAIENTPAGILVAEPSGRVRIANSAALSILGQRRALHPPPAGASDGEARSGGGHPDASEWEGVVYRLFRPDGEPLRREDLPLVRALEAGETIRDMEVVVRRRDGESRSVLANAAPILNDDRIVAGIAVFSDITARKTAEAEILRFRQILEATSDFVGVADSDARLTYLNKAGRRMVGLSEQAPLSDQSLTDFVVEAERSRFTQSALTTAAVDGVWRGEMRLKQPGAQPLPTSQVVIAQHGIGGSVEFYATIGRDISEQKRSALALAKHAQSLERSNEELERFAYVASHDLQEPLRMVASYTRLLQDRYARHLDQDANEFIDYAVDGAKRMQNLIEALLSFSRLGTHGQSFQLVRCEQEFARARENLRLAIEEAGVCIEQDSLPTVPGDASQLGQLFQNLLSNAIKFRSTETPKVSLRVVDRGDKWQFSMTDNGIGLEPVFGDRIFQIFQRLHLRDEYPGTGIGLALCKRIVERHGGEIWVESELARGACFHFTISKSWTEELS